VALGCSAPQRLPRRHPQESTAPDVGRALRDSPVRARWPHASHDPLQDTTAKKFNYNVTTLSICIRGIPSLPMPSHSTGNFILYDQISDVLSDYVVSGVKDTSWRDRHHVVRAQYSDDAARSGRKTLHALSGPASATERHRLGQSRCFAKERVCYFSQMGAISPIVDFEQNTSAGSPSQNLCDSVSLSVVVSSASRRVSRGP